MCPRSMKEACVKQKNAKQRVFEEVWKVAMERGEVMLNCGDAKGVYRVRMSLYNAVAAAKRGEEKDSVLCEAALHCGLQTDGFNVRVARLERMHDVMSIAAQIGMTLDTQTALEKEIAEGEARWAEKLKNGTL